MRKGRAGIRANARALILVSTLTAGVAGMPALAGAQDVLPESPTLQPVETGVTAFIGVIPSAAGQRARRAGKSSRPVQLRDWASFVSRFGEVKRPPGRWSDDDGTARRYLQEAVRGFFANGGSRLWVLAVPAADRLEDPTDELQSLEGLDAVGLFPWLSVRHPDGRRTVLQPPSGHVAGVIARNDRQNGVHRAPANLPVLGAEGVGRGPMRPTSRAATAAPMFFVSVSL